MYVHGYPTNDTRTWLTSLMLGAPYAKRALSMGASYTAPPGTYWQPASKWWSRAISHSREKYRNPGRPKLGWSVRPQRL
ncbi:hypothetical protein NWFMUON74_14040 [Nocardia wallacei]|uniref:Uncharacterized protein n=1 Tax=Nocardia wallacei TaxID=480035 RepID=A0A7G1KEG3_9NOCA|nr:hypothetical protein NWFMUON74_14040 [Nocardia wallacei]